tara:strand:- start:917 stop:1945 length:1029 start_codon:yes stop_codon:yes gene_type:complete
MPHVSGHNPGSRNINKSLRPRVRPKVVSAAAFPKNDNPVARQGGGGGPKGGGPAKIDPTTELGQSFVQKYNTDGRYGYYNTNPNHQKYALGEYVPAFRDMMDGGGFDTNDTFFKGAGPISTLLNVAKIAPYGQSETPREQIGFRDITDMRDRGGPQHSGGEFEGGGTISMVGNLMDKLSGREATPKTRYYEGPQTVGLMVPNEATPALVTSPEVALGRFERPNARNIRASFSGNMVRRPVPILTDDDMGLPTVPIDQGLLEVSPVTPLQVEPGFDAYGVSFGEPMLEMGQGTITNNEVDQLTAARQTVIEMMGPDAFEKLDADMQNDIVKRFMSMRTGTDLQ